jgi:hypothetical protein
MLMAEIPAPLASRHTAVAVVVVSLLGAVAAVATLVIPIDATSPLPLVVARQLVFAVQALVLALAVGILWRTVAKRSLPVTLAVLCAGGGLLLLALAQAVWIVVPTDWGTPPVRLALGMALLASMVLAGLGFLGLGVSLLRRGLWRGPMRATLLVASVATAVVAGCAVLAPAGLALAYAVWSLVLIGLAAGLRTRRAVANPGVPQGAALTEQLPSA